MKKKSIQFTNENINKNIIQTTVWFFGKQRKNKIKIKIGKHDFTTKSKTLTSRLQKKEKQRNPLKRAVIKKELKPHMAIG